MIRYILYGLSADIEETHNQIQEAMGRGRDDPPIVKSEFLADVIHMRRVQ